MTASGELSRGLKDYLDNPPRRLYRQGTGLIPLRAIRPSTHPVRSAPPDDSLSELVASIRAKGVLQPIIVRPVPGYPHQFDLVVGERRRRAAQLAGLSEIPALVRELSNEDVLAVSLIENVQRENLSSIEEARALERLVREFGLTHEQVAEAVGRSRAMVSNLLRLLELPPAVTTLIEARSLGMGHARALLALEDEQERVQLAQMIAERQLSVRETESQVRKRLAGEVPARASPPVLSVISEVGRGAGLRMELQQRSNGSGRILIDFDTPGARDAVLAALRPVIPS